MKRDSSKPKVAILMGSDSDLEVMREAEKRLDYFGIPHETRILSAHRSPLQTQKYAASASKRGLEVIIVGAGAAAHLAGAVAAHTTLPVIGVPIDSSSLKGLDALLSTVQMPAGVPVAVMAVDKPGATNAGIFAAEILATSSDAFGTKLTAQLKAYKAELARAVGEKSARVKQQLENPQS